MTTPRRSETLPVREASHILLVRQLVRACATELGFGVSDQTKLVTAASEFSRNTLIHGGGGTLLLGVRLTFEDTGPGIADLEQAMTNGFTTKGGLGLGQAPGQPMRDCLPRGRRHAVTATRWT